MSEVANQKDRRLLRLVFFFAEACATFLLEVLGGAGAVWGFSEWGLLRGSFGDNNDAWRIWALFAFCLCLCRWSAVHAGVKLSATAKMFSTFLLEVVGGTSAMWGVLEIVGVRVNYPDNCHDSQVFGGGWLLGVSRAEANTFHGINGAWGPGYETCSNTYWQCRLVCLIVLVWMLLRWSSASTQGGRIAMFNFYCGTFLLEVLGGAGALWGFAEVAGPGGASARLGWGDIFYGQRSFDFWRRWCGLIFLLCLVRWITTRVIPNRFVNKTIIETSTELTHGRDRANTI